MDFNLMDHPAHLLRLLGPISPTAHYIAPASGSMTKCTQLPHFLFPFSLFPEKQPAARHDLRLWQRYLRFWMAVPQMR